ncbi:MAG: right-handed parallel beta-helix repeat-containing protein [Acidobacteriaceae bacterium]
MNRRCWNLVMLVFCLSMSGSLYAATASPALLYVSTHGSDSNPGTKDKPFLTVQRAADVAKPGDTINLRGGKYCERLAVTSSGNASQGFITFRSEPGETAMLDGSCLTPEVGDSPMVALRNVSYVKIEHLEIGSYKTADRTRVPAGIRVYGHGSHIEILDNNVHNIEQTYPGREGPGRGANGFGIAVYGTDATSPITDLIVDGNEVHNLQTGSSESLVLNGNVTNFRVTRNRVHNNNNIGIDIIGFERTAPDPSVDRARDGIVAENHVYDITSRGNPAYGNDANSDGIYVDGGTRVVIERNIVNNVDFGIELASEHFHRDTSYIIARNNLIYSCHTAGISIGGYDEKRGSTHDTVIVNNTLYKNDAWHTGTGEIQMQFYLRNNVFKNNIVYIGDSDRVMRSRSGRMDPNTPTVTFDHNLYYSPAGANAVKWSFDGKDYSSFQAYVKATGEDRDSKFAEPKFVDPAAHNFHLKKDSPAIGAGVNLGKDIVGSEDLDGNPRCTNGKIDLGCYEMR